MQILFLLLLVGSVSEAREKQQVLEEIPIREVNCQLVIKQPAIYYCQHPKHGIACYVTRSGSISCQKIKD